jgi:hypothetical protein
MSSECPSKLSVVVRCRQGTSVTAHLERYNTTKQLFDLLNIHCFQVTLFLSLTNLLPHDFSFHEGGRSRDAKPDPPKKKGASPQAPKQPPYSRMPRRHRMSRGVVGSRRIPGTSRGNQSTSGERWSGCPHHPVGWGEAVARHHRASAQGAELTTRGIKFSWLRRRAGVRK